MVLPKRIHADELISVHGSISPGIQGIQYNTIHCTVHNTNTFLSYPDANHQVPPNRFIVLQIQELHFKAV
jgi:hypothetical protein